MQNFVSAFCSQLGSLQSKWTGQSWGNCPVNSAGRWGSSCTKSPMLPSHLIAVRNWGEHYIKHLIFECCSSLSESTGQLFVCVLSTKFMKWMHNVFMSLCVCVCLNPENTDWIFMTFGFIGDIKSYQTNLIFLLSVRYKSYITWSSKWIFIFTEIVHFTKEICT
jgi:hypothetical protein